ncbi:MAG: DUF1559 domain-containing protein [Gemmataceae bacterium]
MARYGMLLVMAGWACLAAGEDAGGLPDDLARVPAAAQGVVSVRVADLYGSDLGKELRKAFGKDGEKAIKEFRDHVGVDPADIERMTAFTTDPVSPGMEGLVIVRVLKKLDAPKILANITRGGKEETFGGQKVVSGVTATAFVSADGKTFVVGQRSAVEKLLESKPGKPAGPLAAMLDKAAKHHLTAYADPSSVAAMADKLPPPFAPVKPLIAAKDGVAWLDVGYTSKMGMKMTFADDKSAARARKVLDAGRALGSLTLSGLTESVAGKSKPLAEFLGKVEKTLDDATVEQKGTAVAAALELTVEKEAATYLIKEVMLKTIAASARMRASNNLKQLGLAFHNYHDVHGALPPSAVYDKDGKALLSWRVMVLPYIEQDALYREFRLDEPWDSEHNKKLLPRIPPVFVSPHGKASAVGGTFYQGFHGKGGFFDGKRGLRFTDFTDGLSNTLMVVEAPTDVPWTKPDDVPFDADGKLPKVGGLFEGGFNALFCDGSVRFLKATIKPDTLKAAITRNGGEVLRVDD